MDELKEKPAMSNWTPVMLNGSLLLVTGGCLAKSTGYDGLFVRFLAPLIFIVGNGFLLIKALVRREAGLALVYFLVIVGMIWFLTMLKVPGKIGG